MERERGFNFQLLIPSKGNKCQAVRPQENVENCSVIKTLQKGFGNFHDKEQSILASNTHQVAPNKPTQQGFPKMKVVPPMEKEEKKCSSVQLFSKLFDEVEKIRCWKVQTDSDVTEKERKLQENKRIIESQSRTIQELQFCNDSLSLKLQEQADDTESLRNKNNATKNLCNILKDTFQRTAEKMQIFESEREETHHLFVGNNENIQKLIGAFESLRFQAEADQQEMKKVQEKLQQSEDLKDKYHHDCSIKEKEVAGLQTKFKNKENELQKLLLDFSETQKCYGQLQETTNKQNELLKRSKAEQECLLQELQNAKQHWEETQKKCTAIAVLLEQSKEEHSVIIQNKDARLEELNRVQDKQAEKLEQSQANIQELQKSLALETQRAKELRDELCTKVKELERRNTLLKEAAEQSAKKNLELTLLQDDLDKKSKCIDSMKFKVDLSEVRLTELIAELSKINDESLRWKNEVEVASAANTMLTEACDAAVKAKEDLMEKFKVSENTVQELEGCLLTEKQTNRDNTFQIEQLKNEIKHHEGRYKELLFNFNELQSEKTAIQQKFEFGVSSVKAFKADMKESDEKTMRLRREIQELESENQSLRNEVKTVKHQIQRKCKETETLGKKIEENFEHLQDEITKKEKKIKAVETKLLNLRKHMNTALDYQKENKLLKNQVEKESRKSSQLETLMSEQQEEHKKLQKCHEEEIQGLFNDLESKSALASELTNEVEKHRLAAAEAIKNKEETEVKCQQKIADMVALMEKHKGHYERIVGEKDAELVMEKKKENEAFANCKSLELELEKLNTDIDQLKRQLKTEVTAKENLLEELSDMRKEMSSIKTALPSHVQNKESSDSQSKQGGCAETPKESLSKRYAFEFSKTPASKKDDRRAAIRKKPKRDSEAVRRMHGAVPKTKDLGDIKRFNSSRTSDASKIRSYRIKTPPSAADTSWMMGKMDLDSKSDSSDQSDVLSFAGVPNSNIVRKIRSPARQKSPEKLKLAAMKRMRDAGWTAVIGSDQKRKKVNEKIFA